MTVSELIKSLSKFGPDDANSEVVFQTIDLDGNLEYHLLAYTGYLADPTYKQCIILGSDEAAYVYLRNGQFNKEDFGPKENLDKWFPPKE